MQKDWANKRWLRRGQQQLKPDTDRIVFWAIIALLAIAVAHGWL